MTQMKLTLSCPQAVLEDVVEYLLDSKLLPAGFTTIAANTHGADFESASLREKVRGRIHTALVMTILPAGNVAPLLEGLRASFRGPRIQYWTEAVHDFGDFA
jgi:Protein of unknown function (DUF3240)